MAQQVTLPRDQTHVGRKKTPGPRAQSLAPALEVGLVMGEEIGESASSLRQRGRIENDLDQPREVIVLDNEDVTVRHIVLGGMLASAQQALRLPAGRLEGR
jgi:hypothetical protein